MVLWIWIALFSVAGVLGWLILLPRPNNQSLDLVERFLPYIVGVIGVYLIVRGYWPYGLGLIVFFFGSKAVSKTVNTRRLKRLDQEARNT
jgi:hypothetical protein